MDNIKKITCTHLKYNKYGNVINGFWNTKVTDNEVIISILCEDCLKKKVKQ